MKKVCILLSFIFCLNSFILSVFSFSIDGIDSGVEWDGATYYKFIDGESNCGVNFGLVKIKLDNSDNSVYYCFHFSDPNLLPDNSNAGISLSVDGSQQFEITASDSAVYENVSPYSFESAIYIDENNGATCEVRFGIKTGLPQNINSSVRFIDSDGCYSNYYDFIVVNEEYTVNNSILHPTADNTDPIYNPYTDTQKSTKIKTTKTTKAKTTKASTTKKKASEETKGETLLPYVEIKTSPPYSYTGRIKNTVSKTKKVTTVKTTKPKEKIRSGVTVYYHEKEVIISQVYVTQQVFDSVSDMNVYPTDNTETESSFLTSAGDTVSLSNEVVTLSEGIKYKKVISVIGILAFAVVAVVGTYSAKNKS